MATNRSNFPPRNNFNRGDQYQQQFQPQIRGTSQNPNVNPQQMMYPHYNQFMAPPMGNIDHRAMNMAQQQMYYATHQYYTHPQPGHAPGLNPYYSMAPNMAAMTQVQQPMQQQPPQVQHSAHSSPTPPMQQNPQMQAEQQQQQQQQAPPPYKPKRSAGITIKDPNTGSIVAKEELAQQERARTEVTPPKVNAQDKEQRKKFQDQVLQSVKAPPSDTKMVMKPPAPPSASPKVTMKPPVAIESKSPVKTDTHPAKQSPVKTDTHPAKQITPTAILQNSRSNSQSEEKTPEKQIGKEMSVQTTPSLHKTASAQAPPPTKIPVPPKFEESKTVEVDSAPISKDKVNDRKLDGETIIIDNSSTKEVKSEHKINGVEQKAAQEQKAQEPKPQEPKPQEPKPQEPKPQPEEPAKPPQALPRAKKDEGLVISIPNGQSEIAHEDPSSASEESSVQFETPPATPSEVKPEFKPEFKPDVKLPEPEPAAVEAKPPPQEIAEEVTPTEPAPAPAPVPVPVPVAIKVEEPAEEVEEGEIVEEVVPVPRGRITYSREELLVHREAQDKPPPHLPKYECVMDKPILKMETIRSSRSNNQFVPSWEQGSRNRSRGDRNRSMDKNHSSMMKPRIIEHVMQAPVTRKKSQNAWLSKREDTKPEVKNTNVDKKLLRGNVVAILNKITPQNFKDLSVQILQLNIDNMDKLEVAVEIIFEKAVLEPAFSQTYANLCKVMSSIKFPDEQNPKVSPFRKTLLNRCQKEFFREKDDEKQIDDRIKEMHANEKLSDREREAKMEEFMYERSKLKKKMLGNINFIGELYNLQMISAKIIQVQCINNMLDKKSSDNRMDIESIECLAKLFTTVGQKLEVDAADQDAKKHMFENSFKTFKDLAMDKFYPYRIRFMIQDLVDLRDNGWVPRRQEAKPQRIEDIHREHAREEQEKKLEAAVAQQSRKVKRNDSRDDRMRGSRDGRDKDWNPPVQKKMPTNFDMSKLTGPAQKVDSGSLVLGPSRNQMTWGRGSGTGSGANSPLSGSREDLATTNRFDMLKPHDRDRPDKRGLLPGKTSSAPAPRGKSSSMERERHAAIANARAISSNKRTPSPSPVRTHAKKEPLSDDKIRSQTKSIISEYFSIDEMEEAVYCIREELQLVKKHDVFVNMCLELVFESKASHLPMLAKLFSKLFEEKPPLMNADGLMSGFQKMFESAEDLAIDVPGIYSNFGILLGPCVAKEHVSLTCVKDAIFPLKESNKAGVVVCEVIKHAIAHIGDMGKMKIQQRWAKERLSWPDICTDHTELINKYKFEFLDSKTEAPAASDAPKNTSNIAIEGELVRLLETDGQEKIEKIFSFIDSTVSEKERKEPEFIRELMKTVCNHCINYQIVGPQEITLNEARLTNSAPVLTKYIQCGKNNLELELYALEAVQVLAHNLSHPRGLAYSIFCTLDDEDIITTKGFKHWRDKGQEQLGHGVTRQNLKKFFDELDESDSNPDPANT